MGHFIPSFFPLAVSVSLCAMICYHSEHDKSRMKTDVVEDYFPAVFVASFDEGHTSPTNTSFSGGETCAFLKFNLHFSPRGWPKWNSNYSPVWGENNNNFNAPSTQMAEKKNSGEGEDRQKVKKDGFGSSHFELKRKKSNLVIFWHKILIKASNRVRRSLCCKHILSSKRRREGVQWIKNERERSCIKGKKRPTLR